MNDAVPAHDHLGVDISGGGILDGDPGEHECIDGAAPEHRLGSGQLTAVVDPQHLVGIGGHHALDRSGQECDDVGEVVLTLCVRGAQAIERRPELSPVEDVHPGVGLHRHGLARGQIRLLDDAEHMAIGVADDPAHSRGISRNGQKQRAGPRIRGMSREQALECLGRDQRRVAVRHEDRPGLAQRRGNAAQGIPGAMSVLLLDARGAVAEDVPGPPCPPWRPPPAGHGSWLCAPRRPREE